jgi:hypothetical protein
MKRRFSITTALVLVALAVLAALAWPRVRQTLAIAALQEAFPGATIGYVLDEADYRNPGPVARTLRSGVTWAYTKVTGSTSTWDPLRVRLDSLFWRHISGITVRYPRGMHGNAVEVLQRFPNLTSFQLEDSNRVADWEELCRGIRRMHQLTHLDLASSAFVGKHPAVLTDASLAPLAGHPNLRMLVLHYGYGITPASADVLATLPRLETLYLRQSANPSFLADHMEAFRTKLPIVKVHEG